MALDLDADDKIDPMATFRLRDVDVPTALTRLRTAAKSSRWKAELETDPDDGSVLRLYAPGPTRGIRGDAFFCIYEASSTRLAVFPCADEWLPASKSGAAMRGVLARLREVADRLSSDDRKRIRLRVEGPSEVARRRRPKQSRTIAPLLDAVVHLERMRERPHGRRVIGWEHHLSDALYRLCAQVARTGASLDVDAFARILLARKVVPGRVRRLAYLFMHLTAFASRGHRSRRDASAPAV